MKLRNYCLGCRKHTNNIGSKTVTMTNKVIRDKSRCAQCLSDKSRLMKQKLNKKVVIKYHKTNMLTYCLKCKRNTENKEAQMMKTKNGRVVLSSKCAVCGSKKSRFMKEQEAKGLLSKLRIKTLLSKMPLLADSLF